MKRTLAIILSVMMILPFCLAFGANAAGTPTAIYIDDINSYGSSQLGTILLYGEGMTAASFGVNGHNWWSGVVITFNAADGSFVVTQTLAMNSGTYATVTLGAGDVMLMTHDTYVDTSFDTAIRNLAVGDKLYAYGFNFANSADTEMLDSSSKSDVVFTTYEPMLGDDYYGYVAPPEPPKSNVVSLGASVNTELGGIRFGSEFTKNDARGEVLALGTLILPESKLGSDELNLELAASNELVANVLAKTIDDEDYVAGQSFEDYESFVYYVTVIGLNDYQDLDLVARPYVTYKSNEGITTYYGEELVRNITEVAAIAGN